MVERDLIIPLRVKKKHRYGWTAASLVMVLGSVAWIAVNPSWLSIVSGGVLIALAVWVWVTMLVTKRMAAGAPYQLVVTRERVSSPWWEPAMGPRAGLWIGRAHSQTGSLRALFIEPLQASDVELPPSRVLRVNRMRDSTPLP